METKTPLMLNRVLWERSGHWENYRENMYTTRIDEAEYAIKPMNCPGGMLSLRSQPHSYKDLPIRAAEVGLVHRHELSGVLSGLFRVRAFHQDDAHIFMTPDQIESGILGVLHLVERDLQHLWAGVSPGAVHAPGKIHRHRRPVGDGHQRAAGRPGGLWQRLQDQRGRRRLLRAQNRRAHQGRLGAHLAVRHDPARHGPARTLRL